MVRTNECANHEACTAQMITAALLTFVACAGAVVLSDRAIGTMAPGASFALRVLLLSLGVDSFSGMAVAVGAVGLLLIERDSGVFGFKHQLDRMPDDVFAAVW